MRVDQIGSAGGGPSGAAAGEPTYPGRIDVEERVFRKVAEEASASVIGVSRSDVSVEVADYRGGMAVRLSTKLPIPDLEDTAAINAGPKVLDRASALQEQLQQRLSHLFGKEIHRINITITGATTPKRRRVK
ncbi:hypothetical protein [Microbacterium sp. P03]|uniref:hypothetical protein n=1 Tax=Microbacterium sp. P03 TaxID=3366946 RepID=UPI003745D6E4